jgi:hypothetical protein
VEGEKGKMSKYNIDITPNLWYVVKENKTYYFFEFGKYVKGKITGEQIAHIKEIYNGYINNAEFIHKEIKTNKKIEKSGLSLCLEGFHNNIQDFPETSLMDILQEPLQRIREFETVIYIKDENRAGNAYGYFGSDRGIIYYNFTFTIFRRAANEKLTKSYKETCYDYYGIPYDFDPDDDNVINYLPLEKDLKFSKTKNQDTIILLYTKEKYLRLKQIANAFDKLGHSFQEFLSSDMKKLLPEFEKKVKK